MVTTGGRGFRSSALSSTLHAFLDVGLGDTADRVAEFGRDEFSRVGVDHVARLQDLALFHEVLDHVDRALRHAARQFLDGDRLGQNHFAQNLFARLLMQGALELLLAAAHRRERAGARLLTGGRRRQRQLAAAAVFLAFRLGGTRNFRGDETLDRRAAD